MNYSQEQLKELASQLKNPKGEKGIETATQMSISNHTMISHGFKHADIQPKNSILELGFANGKHLPTLLDLYDVSTYHGLEISELMVDEASNHLKDIPKTNFHIYNGQDIPVSIKNVDRAITINTIYFWEDPDKLISQIYNCLSENGKFVITFALSDFMKDLPFTKYGFHLYSIEKVRELFEKSKFNSFENHLSEDIAISKTGEKVNRRFTSCILSK